MVKQEKIIANLLSNLVKREKIIARLRNNSDFVIDDVLSNFASCSSEINSQIDFLRDLRAGNEAFRKLQPAVTKVLFGIDRKTADHVYDAKYDPSKILRKRLTTEELEHVNSFFRESGRNLTESSESLRTEFVNRNKDFRVERGAFYNYHRAFKLAHPE